MKLFKVDGESSGSRKLEGVYEGGTGETGAPLKGYIIYRYIDKKKVLPSTEFQSFQHLSTVFVVVLSLNQISIISTIPTGVPGSFPLFNCQDIWMIFATPRKRSKVFSRRPTWMAQARKNCSLWDQINPQGGDELLKCSHICREIRGVCIWNRVWWKFCKHHSTPPFLDLLKVILFYIHVLLTCFI